MNNNTVLKLTPNVPSIEQSRAEIFELLNVSSRAGLNWERLPESDRNHFCRAADLTRGHVNLPLNHFNELDRLKLLKVIQSFGRAVKPFMNTPFQDFK